MNEALAVAVVTAAATIITGVLAAVVSVVNSRRQANVTRELIEYKVGELTKRVEEHNHVIERTYALEKTTALLDEQIRVANHRIKDLEEEKG